MSISPPQYDEAALLTRIAQADQSAFTALFHRYKDRVYEIALAYTGSVILAEEITQDVFMRLWAHREKLPALHSLAAWLFTLARNRSFNVLRNQSTATRREKELLHHLPPAITPEGQRLYQQEMQQLIQEALALLSPAQKEAFVLSKMEGLSREEGAARMNIAPNTFKVHLLKAIRVIRAYLVSRDVFGWLLLAGCCRW
ncbi:MAG: RNA polymerase sigma-70 factor [Candidatus Pseudobacter hemicellulosilyticus]|uniref:RNA polymerase sigma-70 factor n=1 Tax=Candidatus Pseudobacter hemicellulosilyticus TaxID=3121375 RepID=A0AAJ5X1E9_9BACT|nr:MAG: RNA polymerase sigma-70 factor [Pseudobacter sp.]